MSKVILFAGTTEGRQLSEWLCDKRIPHTLCVATEYGEQVLKPHPLARVCRGRMDQAQMEYFFREEGAEIIVDATHPYACLVTENIRTAAKQAGLSYLRLLREGMEEAGEMEEACDQAIRTFPTTEACADYLLTTRGPIFLTTGSKELALFCQREPLKSRLIARVLPGRESIAICEAQGIPGKQIVAMQGPFSKEMNLALLKNYGARILVTKASGKAGGFLEKLEAAKELGVRVCIIGRQKAEDGDSFQQICEKLEAYIGLDAGFSVEMGASSVEMAADSVEMAAGSVEIAADSVEMAADSVEMAADSVEMAAGSVEMAADSVEIDQPEAELQISLIGCGMGHPECLTGEAGEALQGAEYVFGAARLLRDMKIEQESHPWYLAKDILPFLEKVQAEEHREKTVPVAILFSGDTGFYSGCKKMYQALSQAVADGRLRAELQIYPGVSSIASLAAAVGESWEDAKILSIHGMGEAEKWSRNLVETVKTHGKTFLLLSGVKNLQTIGQLLEEMEGIRILAGYQMSYPEEEILELKAGDCRLREKEGLYSLLIMNEKPVSLAEAIRTARTGAEPQTITHGLPDTFFIRGKVPMTKEEVRTISISRLKLTDQAVVYDVGSGTGSVAVEIARLSPSIQVYAIERKDEGLDLIRQNKEKFGLSNIEVIPGLAPQALEMLPTPSHVFIGGSGGQMRSILTSIFQKNPTARIVANAVSFETLQELLKVEETYSVEEFEILQLSATRSRKLGNYHMMQGENPVWICSFVGKKVE